LHYRYNKKIKNCNRREGTGAFKYKGGLLKKYKEALKIQLFNLVENFI
jgi:hypothetical protein